MSGAVGFSQTPNHHNGGLFTTEFQEIANKDNLNFNELLNITENQKLEWLRTQLKQRKDEYTTTTPLYVMCGSFNVNAKKPCPDLTNWLNPGPLASRTLQPLHNAHDISYDKIHIKPDIYAIGFQEIVDLKFGTGASALGNDRSTQQASKYWEQCILQNIGGDKYTLLKTKHLVGLSLHVYVKNDLLPHIYDIRTDKCGVGVLGRGGNKGSVCIRFRIHDSSFVFVNVHLAAHASKADKRNQDFHSIMERIKFTNTNHVNPAVFPFQVINSQHTSSSTINDSNKISLLKKNATNDIDDFDNDGDDDEENVDDHYHDDYTNGVGQRDDEDSFPTTNNKHQNTTTPSSSLPQHVYYPPSAGLSSQHTQPPPPRGKNMRTNDDSNSMSIEEHDNCFIFGDCNARLAVPLSDIFQIYTMIDECNQLPPCNILSHDTYLRQGSALSSLQQPIRFSKLLQHDQLLTAKANGQAFENWMEGIIDFPPTYKYLPGTTQYDPEHKRVPAWTDRHMYLVKPDEVVNNSSDITLLEYTSAPKINTSDHFPVRSIYRVATRTLNIHRKIQLCQLLLKHYFTMQMASLPRVMFNQNIYNIGYIYYNVPVKGNVVLYNPTKKSIWWRLISPYDAKHVVDDHDTKKMFSKNHLNPQPAQYSQYQLATAYKNALIYQQQHNNGTAHLGDDHPDVDFSTSPWGNTIRGGKFSSQIKQAQQVQNHSNITSQYNTLLSSYKRSNNNNNTNNNNNAPSSASQQPSSGPAALITASQQFGSLGMNSAFGTNPGHNHGGAAYNINANNIVEVFDINAMGLQHEGIDSKNPALNLPPQQHLYLHHESFQYRHANKPYSSNNQLSPYPHVVTYLPQRNDEFTHIHPSWLRFGQLQGKIEPGGVHTVPFVVHVKGHDALQIVTNNKQLTTNIFVATSFTSFNQHNNMTGSTNANAALSNTLEVEDNEGHDGHDDNDKADGSEGAAQGGTNLIATTATTTPTTITTTTVTSTTIGPAMGIVDFGGKNAPHSHLDSSSQSLFQPPTASVTTTIAATATGAQKSNMTLAPSYISLGHGQHQQLHRSANVNVFMASISGTYQYTTYGLSLAFLCDVHESIRSRQVQQALFAQHYKQLQQQQQQQQMSLLLRKKEPTSTPSGGSDEFSNLLNYFKSYYQSVKNAELFSIIGAKGSHGISAAQGGVAGSSRPLQPIPKEFFQLVDALINTGLDNPNHFIFPGEYSQFIKMITTKSRTTTTVENTQKQSLLPATSATSAATTSQNNTAPLPQQRLYAIGPCANHLLQSALITAIDEQRPIMTSQYQNTPYLWFTVLDLLYNLPEPLFPLVLIDKIAKFRQTMQNYEKNHFPEPNQMFGLNQNQTTTTTTTTTTNTNIISTVSSSSNIKSLIPGKKAPVVANIRHFSSPTQIPPSANPFSFIKYFPRPLVKYHQQLYEQQLLSLMSTFCFYLLKWLPLQHYNLFIYLLALVKKIISSISHSHKNSLSITPASPNHNGTEQVDIEQLKRYIVLKFTQACCQIKSVQLTNLCPFPLSIISHMIDHDIL